MYLNRVLMEFRATSPAQKEWVAAVKDLMAATQALVEGHCPGGLVWGAVAGASTAAPATPSAAKPGTLLCSTRSLRFHQASGKHRSLPMPLMPVALVGLGPFVV